MKKKTETYLGVKAFEGLTGAKIKTMNESELRALARTGSQILKSANVGRKSAGLPLLDVPKRSKKTSIEQLRQQVVYYNQQVKSPQRTVTGIRTIVEKSLAKVGGDAKYHDRYVERDDKGNVVAVHEKVYVVRGLVIPESDMTRFWNAFHKEQERIGAFGSIGSGVLLDLFTEQYDSSIGDLGSYMQKRLDEIDAKEKIEEAERNATLKGMEDAETEEDEDWFPF